MHFGCACVFFLNIRSGEEESIQLHKQPLVVANCMAFDHFWWIYLPTLCDFRKFNSQFGETALMKASSEDLSDCVKLLLEGGADKEIKDMVRAVDALLFPPAFLIFQHPHDQIVILWSMCRAQVV
jgi:hypothetical protein